MTYGHTLTQEPLSCRNLPWSSSLYFHFFCWIYAQELRSKFFKKYSLPQNNIPIKWGIMKFTTLYLHPLQVQQLHTKFGKDWPNSRREDYVLGPHKTNHDGRQLIATGHMSDLKIELDQHVNQTL